MEQTSQLMGVRPETLGASLLALAMVGVAHFALRWYSQQRFHAKNRPAATDSEQDRSARHWITVNLQNIVAQAREIVHAIHGLNTRYIRSLIEQAAIVGALDADALVDPARTAEVIGRVVAQLDRLADEVERGWRGESDGQGGITLSRTIRGVAETHALDAQLLASSDIRRIQIGRAHV